MENGEKPPPRVCPRCNSDNTKFSYYNNYSMSQPRYSCKNCHRFWTHGGTLKNIPIGGSCRKPKRARVDAPVVSGMVSVDIQQVPHQPIISYVQENNEFVGSFGASPSSSVAAVGNISSSLADIHGRMVTNVHLSQNFGPNRRLVEQGYYSGGSGNPIINQSIGGYVDNDMNQVNQRHHLNQNFNNTTNMNHNASTSGSRGSDMNMNTDNNKLGYNSM